MTRLLIAFAICCALAPMGARAAAQQSQTVTLEVVGDVMFGWGIDSFMATYGSGAPFDRIRPILARADAIVGNLECPLSYRGVATKSKPPKQLKERKEFLLRGSPVAAAGLADAGFAAMTLANNHTMDYGFEALFDTIEALRESGVGETGAGGDIEEAQRPAYFDRRGVRFALLGVSEVIPRGYLATQDEAGIAPGRDPTTGLITASYLRALEHEVRDARHHADVVIVYEHWGKELVGPPTPDHIRLARALVDAGATVVLGAHPHVLGPVETYHHGLIAYSLGNFVFDTRPGAATTSALLEIRLRNGAVESWQADPLQITHGVPAPADREVAAEVKRSLTAYGAAPAR